MAARRGQLNKYYSSRGIVSYEIELAHDGLHKHRIIKGNDPFFVQRKAEVQLAEWEDQWRRKRAAQSRTRETNLRRAEREKKQQYQEEQKEQAAE